MEQPTKKFTQKVRGQKREYYYMTTVDSLDELEQFRFENFCAYLSGGKPLHIRKPITLPCKWKKSGKGCEFELRALPPELEDNGTIHVYGHSQHNHPVDSPEKRAVHQNVKELMPDENPPEIYSTPSEAVAGNIDWTFLRTVADYEEIDKFRGEERCYVKVGGEEKRRCRIYCNLRSKRDCQFVLLAMKTTKQRYHVYKYGEHTCKQSAEDEEEHQEEEDDESDGPEEDDDEEDISQPEPEQHEEEEMDTEEREYPLDKCQRRLQSNIRKEEMEKTKKWMGRIDQAQIGRVVVEMDVENVANLMSMANIDIRIDEANLNFWTPWIRTVIRECGTSMVEELMATVIKLATKIR